MDAISQNCNYKWHLVFHGCLILILGSSEMILRLSNELVNVVWNVWSLILFGVPLESCASRVNEELFEVPSHVWPFDRLPNNELWVGHHGDTIVWWKGQVTFQPSEHLVLALTVDLNLFQLKYFRWLLHNSMSARKKYSEKILLYSTLSNMRHFGTNPFPGRTYFKAFSISTPSEFSWWPNWFDGNESTTYKLNNK